tara:strand:- start:60479 stop:64771 length:4293 start_codon:yes stop_codon:yes gene_type:complete
MAPINRTANSHQTSFLVSQHVPSFVRDDHPKFVTFLEKYYEFASNNSVLETANGSGAYYYGFDSASKVIQDINDVDKTDFDEFVEAFRKQYAYSFPQELYNGVNKATLYKNLLQFYQAVGTEDSFRALFRLLYNEEIEIYYPSRDLLVASGGEYTKRSRIKVPYVENINNIENKKLVGAESGAYATIENVEVVRDGTNNFTVGKIPNATSLTSGATGNTDIYDNRRLLDEQRVFAYVYLTDVIGEFNIYEDLYYTDGDVSNTSVANTVALPLVKRVLYIDNYTYHSANSVVSFKDAKRFPNSPSDSNNTPWGTANIAYANTGLWHTAGPGTGEIKMVGNTSGSIFEKRVLQVGNNDLTDATAYSDLRHFVLSDVIGVRNEDVMYRMTVRARDIGGNSAFSVDTGNRFSAGVVAYRQDYRIIGSDSYANTYNNPFWFVSHKQSIDDQFFEYVGYFGGIEESKTTAGPYDSNSYGNGGRTDLPTGEQKFNSLKKALNGETKLPFGTTYIAPTFKVNEPGGDATYSQGITEIDMICLEEMTALQTQEGHRTGFYKDNSRSLLSTSSNLQDGYYWQFAAYDIRTKQQMGTANGYGKIVRETVHPAGMKMFGTKVSESDVAISLSSEGHLNDTFSPDQLDSLAGWWRADAIGPKNVEYRRYGDSTANGTYGTERNRFPVAFGNFEDLDEDYNIKGGTVVDLIAKGSDDSYFGGRALKIIDKHISPTPAFDFPIDSTGTNIFGSHHFKNMDDDVHHPIVIEPYKKWLLSFYGKVSNTTNDNAVQTNSFGMYTAFGNTSGADTSATLTGNGSTIGLSRFANFDAEDTWQRMSMVLDLTAYDHTRIGFRIQLPNRISFDQPTGNTEYVFDGFMLEEYDPDQHGTEWGQTTPSPYIETGLSGSNVVSWFDQSVNRHHVYANTHGGLFYYPQYVSNAINGKPAIRFSANTVKNTGNVYQYSSIGGSVNTTALELGDATNFKPPTSGFQSKRTGNSSGGFVGGTLSSPSLPRPVANSWTVLAVVKTNLALNAASYDSTLNPTIINSGYAGNEDALSDSASASGTLNLGYEIVGETGAIQADVVNSSAGFTSINSAAIAAFGSLSSSNTESTFRIVGVSVNASTLSGSSSSDLINFHVDGRRFSNSEIHFNTDSFVSGHSGLDWKSQNNYVTSIGKWAPANLTATTSQSVRSVYPYGTKDWDGDIAEILVFNEKLSNNNIAKVEGYLAHKYGLQDNLKHKDDDGSGSPEIEAYRWEFANTADGWDFYLNNAGVRQSDDVDTSGFVWTSYNSVPDSNNEIEVRIPATSVTANLIMEKSTAIQIVGAAYDTFKIRFTKRSASADTEDAYLVFTDVDGNETSVFDQKLDHSGSLGTRYDHTVDLSGTDAWKTKRIKNLKYVFDQDSNGGPGYDVDFVVVAGNSHPHPHKEYAPLTESSNNWNLEY